MPDELQTSGNGTSSVLPPESPAAARHGTHPWVRGVLEEFNLLRKNPARQEPFLITAWNALDSSRLLQHLHDVSHQINVEAGWPVLNEERLRRPHRKPARYVFTRDKIDYAMGVEIGHNELRMVFRMRGIDGSEPKPSYRRYFYRYVVRHLSEHRRVVLPLTGLRSLPTEKWFRYLLSGFNDSFDVAIGH
jgi:hypothetical protein